MHDTPALFDWLLDFMSYQGVSDHVAANYIEQHRGLTWWDIATNLDRKPGCPKLSI